MSVPPALHELEAEIMEEVWRRGECGVREVLDALNDRNDTPRAYTTVMTVMHRLDHKGLLRREPRGAAPAGGGGPPRGLVAPPPRCPRPGGGGGGGGGRDRGGGRPPRARALRPP